MLRIDELDTDDQQQLVPASQDPYATAPAAADHHAASSAATSAAAASVRLPTFSHQLASDAWLEEIRWGGLDDGSPKGSPPQLLLDMNDHGMTFEVLRGADVKVFAHAAAMVLPAMPKVCTVINQCSKPGWLVSLAVTTMEMLPSAWIMCQTMTLLWQVLRCRHWLNNGVTLARVFCSYTLSRMFSLRRQTALS